MELIEKVLKAVLDTHAGDPQLLAVQLKSSRASVKRWLAGEAKPRPAYEAKLRQIYSELTQKPNLLQETGASYRVTPHHPMITEAVDQTLRSIREILHKRGGWHCPTELGSIPEGRRRVGGWPQELR